MISILILVLNIANATTHYPLNVQYSQKRKSKYSLYFITCLIKILKTLFFMPINYKEHRRRVEENNEIISNTPNI